MITLKPVLYGGIFSRFLRPDLVVYAIAGIGSNFNSSNFLVRSFVSFSLRFALGSVRKKVIFQNYSDLHLISRICKLESSSLALIPGSGVNLVSFKYFPDYRSCGYYGITPSKGQRCHGVLRIFSHIVF